MAFRGLRPSVSSLVATARQLAAVSTLTAIAGATSALLSAEAKTEVILSACGSGSLRRLDWHGSYRYDLLYFPPVSSMPSMTSMSSAQSFHTSLRGLCSSTSSERFFAKAPQHGVHECDNLFEFCVALATRLRCCSVMWCV